LQPGYPDFDFAVQTGVIEADAVIAANGIHSVLPDHVVERTEPTARNLWWYGGNGKHVLACPLRAGQQIHFVGFVPADGQPCESWSRSEITWLVLNVRFYLGNT
jgi:hypothetical protein